MRTPTLAEVATFGDGATLDLPGSPRVILVPGHTRRAADAARLGSQGGVGPAGVAADYSTVIEPVLSADELLYTTLPFESWIVMVSASGLASDAMTQNL